MMQGQITKVTKHGAAAGETGRPERTDWTIDQGWEKYTTDEHAIWKTLFERQTKLLRAVPARSSCRGCATCRSAPTRSRTSDG